MGAESSSDSESEEEQKHKQQHRRGYRRERSEHVNELWVFFERQLDTDKQLCGLHALNNLFVPHGIRRRPFRMHHLRRFAKELLTPTAYGDGHRLADLLAPDGMYSVVVLEAAVVHLGCHWRRVCDKAHLKHTLLSQPLGLQTLTEQYDRENLWLDSDDDSAPAYSSSQTRSILGFIVGNGRHWWAIRHLGTANWDIADSLNERAMPLNTKNVETVRQWIRNCSSKISFFEVTL